MILLNTNFEELIIKRILNITFLTVMQHLLNFQTK